jgi:choline dehydrogenase
MRVFGDFDIVIVGAGSAGCVLADRLSEDGRLKVLLLEAGGSDNKLWVKVPLGYGKLFADPSVNWGYHTEPEPQMHDRRMPQPRGRILGGSSSINGLVYMRGTRADYDGWRQMGNVGWGYDDVLPLFKRAEDQSRGADAFHGTGGPLAVSDQTEPHPLCDAFIAACGSQGIAPNPDFNGASQEGAGYFQTTSRRGVRASAAAAYLSRAKRRRNLTIATKAMVHRVTIAEGRATGVVFAQGRRLLFAKARREVILSAGAFGSPQILQLSGIGPGALLRDLDIPVLVDHPGVGADLQDHLKVNIVTRCTEPVTINDDVATLGRRLRVGARWLLQRKGPLTVSAGYAGCFFRTDARLVEPDIQVHFILFSSDAIGQGLHRFPGYTASICQLRPESRGSVMITSPDPHVHPAIRPNYLSTETDRQTVVAALKRLRAILEAPPLRRWRQAEILPGPAVQDDAAWLEHARATGGTIYHPSSTCRMGVDPRAVVDQTLKVRGVERLRVADGSIMPALVSGNTNAPIIMIGEKAADLVKADMRS